MNKYLLYFLALSLLLVQTLNANELNINIAYLGEVKKYDLNWKSNGYFRFRTISLNNNGEYVNGIVINYLVGQQGNTFPLCIEFSIELQDTGGDTLWADTVVTYISTSGYYAVSTSTPNIPYARIYRIVVAAQKC